MDKWDTTETCEQFSVIHLSLDVNLYLFFSSNFGELGSTIDPSQALQVSFLTTDGTCSSQAGGNAQMAVPGTGYLGISTGTTFNGYLFPVVNSTSLSLSPPDEKIFDFCFFSKF